MVLQAIYTWAGNAPRKKSGTPPGEFQSREEARDTLKREL
jgi:hypothetical protein